MRIYPFDGIKGRFTWECEGSPDPEAEYWNMFGVHQTGDGNKTLCGVDLWWQKTHLAEDIIYRFH